MSLGAQLHGKWYCTKFFGQGILAQLEEDVVSFFKDCPDSVFVLDHTSGYERLLLHAVCQFLGLHCHSMFIFLYLWRFLFLIGVLYQVNNLCHSKAASSVNLNAFRERTTSLSEPKKPDSHCIGAKCFNHFATRPLTFFGRQTFEMLRSWNCHVYLH